MGGWNPKLSGGCRHKKYEEGRQRSCVQWYTWLLVVSDRSSVVHRWSVKEVFAEEIRSNLGKNRQQKREKIDEREEEKGHRRGGGLVGSACSRWHREHVRRENLLAEESERGRVLISDPRRQNQLKGRECLSEDGGSKKLEIQA
ncbi:hypothetical protein HAX54_017480 [Datura stramonium]|uniref:Uncharacterized protein n=1 Tax=Datura stramonium TaxID=4076 RepID=A0ABS8S0L0_DATST|nr:hypothetical protein [Datura stramonium]